MPSCPCFPLTTHPETSKLICCYRCSCAQEMFWCQLPQPDACQLLHENCRHSWIWDLLFLGIHIHCITACKPQQVKPPSPPKQLPDSPLSSLFLFFSPFLLGLLCFCFMDFVFPELPYHKQPQRETEQVLGQVGSILLMSMAAQTVCQ